MKFFCVLTTFFLLQALPPSGEDIMLRGGGGGGERDLTLLEQCLDETRNLNHLPAVAAGRGRVEMAMEDQYGKCPGMEGRHRWGWVLCDGPCGGGQQHRWGWDGCGGHCTGHEHEDEDGNVGECDDTYRRWGWGNCEVDISDEYLEDFAEDCQEAGGQYQVMMRFHVECMQQEECCNGEGWEGCIWLNNSMTCTSDYRCHWNETIGCMARPCLSLGTNSSLCRQAGCTWFRQHSKLSHQELPVCLAQSCRPIDFAEQVQRQVEEVWRQDLEEKGEAVTCVASYEALATNNAVTTSYLKLVVTTTFLAFWVLV